ncbi:src kinase-associated phosphoprotein 2 [Clupea harengus]|uniref:Src kinase-associated phosphoprotein 2 n=1 Tax=Clupea harengus TaxID=7950 RepID=A0A6P8G0P3_CLUHA|nr:src kinase-associated phosphoprotein 2 [Clupea harengus]
MRAIPEELTSLIADLEAFLTDGLKGESLSKKTKEKRELFIKRIKDVKASYSAEFKDKHDAEDSDDGDEFDSGGSLHSERTDRDEEALNDGTQHAPVAAQDLDLVFKAGYLEKRRKDHSFFAAEWQKRWCALSNFTFYYYGSEKDKQQKGDFNIEGYTVKPNNTLRKDSKKECCFEISAPDKRVYQFCAASPKEADDWVERITFVLRDMESGIIPEEQCMYDDVGVLEDRHALPSPAPIDDEIYEELKEEDMPPPPPKPVEKKPPPAAPPVTVNKATDYQNYYQGMWDCTGEQADELTFRRGEAIYILSKEYQSFGWWVGELKGSIGIVPKDYLMELYAL